MVTSLSMSDIEKLVAERARVLDRSVTPDRVHVYEDPQSSENGTLVVQIAMGRTAGRTDWTRSRLRMSQAIRDALLHHGDERYPLVEVFAPEEWARRDD